MTRVLIAAVLALAATGLSGTARADDVIVDQYQELTGEIDGNIIVVEGGYCIVQDATIHGDVIAEAGGGVWCLDSYIAGNVEASGATFMMLWWCTVDGYVDARGQQGDEYEVVVRFSTIGGDVMIKQNEALYITLEENTIAGSVGVIRNSSVVAETVGIFVVNNDIGGDLKCVANKPAAEVFGNTVSGRVHVDD